MPGGRTARRSTWASPRHSKRLFAYGCCADHLPQLGKPLNWGVAVNVIGVSPVPSAFIVYLQVARNLAMKRDPVTRGRPGRLRVLPREGRQPLRLAAVRIHYVDLGVTVAVALECDAVPFGDQSAFVSAPALLVSRTDRIRLRS